MHKVASMSSHTNFSADVQQQGSFLLEALVAILIFSMGVLAIVGMQTAAIKNSSESKYRSDANLLANQLIGQMWVSDRTGSTLQTNFQGGAGTDGAMYTAWLGTTTSPLEGTVRKILPGITSTANLPTVAVVPASGVVTVDVYWRSPNEAVGAPAHRHTVVAQIK
jgi:type IV pilus assembly protein PilV